MCKIWQSFNLSSKFAYSIKMIRSIFLVIRNLVSSSQHQALLHVLFTSCLGLKFIDSHSEHPWSHQSGWSLDCSPDETSIIFKSCWFQTQYEFDPQNSMSSFIDYHKKTLRHKMMKKTSMFLTNLWGHDAWLWCSLQCTCMSCHVHCFVTNLFITLLILQETEQVR